MQATNPPDDTLDVDGHILICFPSSTQYYRRIPFYEFPEY
jgi:hypothetical protein